MIIVLASFINILQKQQKKIIVGIGDNESNDRPKNGVYNASLYKIHRRDQSGAWNQKRIPIPTEEEVNASIFFSVPNTYQLLSTKVKSHQSTKSHLLIIEDYPSIYA